MFICRGKLLFDGGLNYKTHLVEKPSFKSLVDQPRAMTYFVTVSPHFKLLGIPCFMRERNILKLIVIMLAMR